MAGSPSILTITLADEIQNTTTGKSVAGYPLLHVILVNSKPIQKVKALTSG